MMRGGGGGGREVGCNRLAILMSGGKRGRGSGEQ